MSATDVIDLDVLRPEPRMLLLAGRQIDVSFVPAGVTFELEALVREMSGLNAEQVQEGGEAARRGFELAIDLCVLFCRRKFPDMDREWFLSNTDAGQLGAFAAAVKDALVRSYEGVNRYQRNPRKAKAT